MKFELEQINESKVETSDKTIDHFSIAKLGKKIKVNMRQPKETITGRGQQNFDVG